jgi:hypothetical protein
MERYSGPGYVCCIEAQAWDAVLADVSTAGVSASAGMDSGGESDGGSDWGAGTGTGMQNVLHQLMNAAVEGDVGLVRRLLQAGSADPSAKDALGRSALIGAAWQGHAHVASMLMDAGANIDAVDNEGSTVVMVAVMNEHADVLAKLLAAGANVDATISIHGEIANALSMALLNGNLKIVMQLQLLAAGADPNAIRHIATPGGDVRGTRAGRGGPAASGRGGRSGLSSTGGRGACPHSGEAAK